MPGPLEGIRVVELGVWVAGPAAGGILADWGADVVKVEPPAGDPARIFGKMLGGDLDSNPPFELDNRSKRSIVLDLGADEGRATMMELLATADVFLTNIRASALARIGLDPDTLLAHNERLVYGLVTGYGTDGPDADTQAYDIAAYWARSGLASLLTPPGGNPPFQRGGMGDHPMGMTAAGMICGALVGRERTGKGQLVTTSLLRQGLYTIGFDMNTYLMWGNPIAVGTREAMGNPCLNNYLCGDGRRFWIVGLEGDRHWPPLARVVGHEEWLDESHDYATARGRAMNARQLIAELDEIFVTKTLDEWAALFATEPDFFWAPLNTLEDVVADEQVQACGALVDVPDGVGGTMMINSPVDFHGTPNGPSWVAPQLGAHTDEITAELAARSSS